MPVPIPVLKVGFDNQNIKFFMIFSPPKTVFFLQIRRVPGQIPISEYSKKPVPATAPWRMRLRRIPWRLRLRQSTGSGETV